MIKNNMCDSCSKSEVCRNRDILFKFDESAKKNLGVDITMNSCENYADALGDAIDE